MWIPIYILLILVAIICGAYSWFYAREVHKTNQRVGFSLPGIIKFLLALCTYLILGIFISLVILLLLARGI